MAYVIRIDKTPQPTPHPTGGRALSVSSTIGTFAMVAKDPLAFIDYIKQNIAFEVSAQERLYIWLGTVRIGKGSKLQLFNAGSYLHQRAALLSDFGTIDEDDFKIGSRHGHRIPLGRYVAPVWKVLQNMASPENLLEKPMTKKYHYLAFTDHDCHRLFHGDEEKKHANCMYSEQSITLGKVGHLYGAIWNKDHRYQRQ
jgi:hypothetical protein